LSVSCPRSAAEREPNDVPAQSELVMTPCTEDFANLISVTTTVQFQVYNEFEQVLSASTSLSPYPNSKSLVATVEDALRLGADAVSVHVNLGDVNEGQMLADLGMVASRAAEWGMPVLAMMYARGPKVEDEYDPEIIRHAARVGQELGADVIKVPYTGDMDSFGRVVEACCVPVVIAGGPKLDSEESLLRMAYDSVTAGGSGLSIGRNIFQHAHPSRLLQALSKVVHDGWSVDQAMEGLGE